MDVIVRQYRAEDEGVWNDFVSRAKNATFLFDRHFMNYHADKFHDHSLMIYADRGLKAVLPANVLGNSLVSHEGLSYGGMILDETVRLEDVIRFFFHTLLYLHEQGFNKITYKCVPANFATLPSFEDQYVMFLLDARLVRRDMSAVCDKNHALRMRESRKSTMKKNALHGHRIVHTEDPSQFWAILENNLKERHGVAPVHSLQEIQLLMKGFPGQIHCFEVGHNELLGQHTHNT
jgi:hypothetical protein